VLAYSFGSIAGPGASPSRYGAAKTLTNRLLALLPTADAALITLHLTTVDLDKGRLIYDPDDPIDTVWFPHNCILSMMTLLENGSMIECATIGREGALGLQAALWPRNSMARVMVQAPGRASRLAVAHLREAALQSAVVESLIHRHADALFGHVIQSVACNALHGVEARFSRWILTCSDRVDGDSVQLTQEFLADMLGVQRTTVTAVAGAMQARGLIRYRRGVVDLVDRAGLEAAACECYGAVRRTFETLLPGAFGGALPARRSAASEG
jgi:CRP-like cAMP-binding protein